MIMSFDESSDPSEGGGGFSARGSTVRSTVARKCREFYLRRLERTETLRRRWSVCEDDRSSSPATVSSDSCSSVTTEEPFRKWNSTLDIAMDHLRREIASLINQDNDLFRQLLSLNDSIAELREQQRSYLDLSQLDDDSDRSRSPSLESLSESDPETTTTPSPASTLSSCSSHCGVSSKPAPFFTTRRPVLPSGGRTMNEPRPRSVCFRCHSNGKSAPVLFRRRALSYANLYCRREDFDSYDSGIHLQGSHSDSDHEIFV